MEQTQREAALNRLIITYEKDVLRLCCMLLHDIQLAEDATQETFLKAYHGMETFRGMSSEKTWLMRIAVNTCRNMRRSAWFRFVDRRVTLEQLPEPAALLLTVLAVGAVAAVWLSMGDVVEQAVVPMALENDGEDVVNTFASDELAQIVEIAEENGVAIPQKLRMHMESGEGYWEEETIMALAKAEFGPIPGRWTLEQQYWFEEMAVAIGFKDYSAARIPGEGDLTYEQALALAVDEMHMRYGAERNRLLDGETYLITRGYNAYRDENGEIQEPTWYFWFEPVSITDDEYIVTMDKAGNVIEVRASLDRSRDYDAIHDHYSDDYGQEKSWPQAAWVAFGRDMQGVVSDLTIAKCFQKTQYIEVPQGAIEREEAIETAQSMLESGKILNCSAVCMLSGDERNLPIWKVRIYMENGAGRQTMLVEIDCMTGEMLNVDAMEEGDGWYKPFVPQAIYKTLRGESHPEGLG